MAEFTEFMNKRVDHFLAMFKELRSGSITYPEIAKRENVRPPINKVCQKLGVKKVAQMTDDEQLHQAIRSVVYDIEMKRRARQPTSKDEEYSDVTDNELLTPPPGLTSPAVINGPPGLAKPTTTPRTDASTIASSNSTATPLKQVERLVLPPPPLQCDSLDLLKVVLAVRTHNGKVCAAVQQVQRDSGIAVTSTYIQEVVSALCQLLGRSQLDDLVSHEDTVNAVHRYVQLSRDAHGSRVQSPKPSDSAAAVQPNSAPVANNKPKPATPTTVSSAQPAAPTQVAAQTAVALPALPIEEVYAQFWELAYKLFLYVCNPYRHCVECLTVVEDLVTLLERSSTLRSPLTALALDSVIQRAMYELSDKVARPFSDNVLQRLQLTSGSNTEDLLTTPACSVRNIELCVTLMGRYVSPICVKIRDDFHQRHQLPPPPAGAAWCEKVLTLTRQLQELVAWSSPHAQTRIPAFIPAGRYYEPSPRDAMCVDGAEAEAETPVAEGSKGSAVPAAAMSAALKAKDSVLCEVTRHLSNSGAGAQVPELEASLQMTLHKLLHQAVASDCSLALCGAGALGFSDVIGKLKLDFTALSAPYHMNLYDLSPEEQAAEVGRIEALTEQLRTLEGVVETDKVTEVAWKHLKACARDFHTQSQDYIIKLTSADPAGQQYGAVNSYDAHGQRGGYGGGYYGHYSQPQQQQAAYGGYGPTTPPEVILQVAEDADLLRRLGDGVVEKYQSHRAERTASTPVLVQVQQKAEELQEQLDRPEREKSNFVRKFCKSLDRVLKDQRFLYVRVVSNKVRFTHVNFEQQLSPHMTVSCNVIACNPMPIQMTQLLYDYITMDASGKVRDYFQTIKLFVAAHHIADATSGFLSTTAWYVMALHVLLRHDLVPNIHMHRLYPSSTGSRPAAVKQELSPEQQERLVTIPLLALLDLFFRYYVEHLNIFTSVVTLRDRGTVLRKTQWPGSAVLWRVAVEDPFEPMGCGKPYDLGCTLSRPGQLTTYKALRRAVYGLHTIMTEASPDCRESAKKLFSKVELINLARKSDYMGAVITASPAWVRPTEKSVLDTPEYAEYAKTAHRRYETPEGAKQLLLTRDAHSGPSMASDSASPVGVPTKRLGGHVPPIQTVGLSALPYPPVPGAYSTSPVAPHAPVTLSPPPPRPHSTSPPPVHMRSLPPATNMHMHGMSAQPAAHGFMQQAYAPQSLTITPPVHYPSAYAYNTQMPSSPMVGHGYGATMYSPHQYASQVPPPPPAPPVYHMSPPPMQPMSPHTMHPMSQSGYPENRGYGERSYMDHDPRMQQQRSVYPQQSQPGWPQQQPHQHMAQHHQQQAQYPPYSAQPAATYQGGDHRGYRGSSQRSQGSGYDAPYAYGQDQRYNPGSGPAHGAGPQRGQQYQYQQSSSQYHPESGNTGARRAVEPLALPSQHHDRGEMQARLSHAASGSGSVSGSGSARLSGGSAPGTGRVSDDPTPRSLDRQDSYVAQLSARYNGPPPQEDRRLMRSTSGEGYPRPAVGLEDRYAPSQTRLPERGPAESRYVPALQLTTGSMTARPADKVRFSDEEHFHHAGSASARYPSVEDRYARGPAQAHPPIQQLSRQSEQHQPQHHQTPVPRLDLSLRNTSGGGSGNVSSGAPSQQPRFAAENDPIVDFSAPPTSARQSSGGPAVPPLQLAVSKGDLSARRGSGDFSARRGSASDLSATLVSPRDPAVGGAVNSGHSGRSHKSPVVPLIPLESIAGFQAASSSSSSSDYGNPLHSDRSSIYMSTARSEAILDTGRSAVGGGAGNGNPVMVGGATVNSNAPASSRSTATHAGLHGAFSMSAVSMPNTSRTTEFATSHNHHDQSSEEFRGGYYGHGLSLSSRPAAAEDSMDSPGRTAPLTEQNLAEAQPTNRLGYMGLDDLNVARRGFPLPTIRSAAASSNGSQCRSGSELDVLIDRINGDSLGGQALNSARSSRRGSNGSAVLSPDLHEYSQGSMLSPRQMTPRQLTPRREPVLDSITECAAESAMEDGHCVTKTAQQLIGLKCASSDSTASGRGGGSPGAQLATHG